MRAGRAHGCGPVTIVTMKPDQPTPDLPFVVGRITPGGQTFEAWKNQSLLDSIEQGGLSWPNSCRVGSCRTCLSKRVSGVVRYEMEWPGLTAEEKDEGCVLPCVAFPVTDVVLKDPLSD